MAELSDLQRMIREERRKGEPALEAPVSLDSVKDAALDAEVAQTLAVLASSHPTLHASLSRLNPAQITAVLSEDKATLVRAQVGSGKTTVLVYKVLYLHLVHGIPLGEIAVLTFTNKAAREIRHRLLAMAMHASVDTGDEEGNGSSDDAWLIGTFHGVARTLLIEALPLGQLGFRPDFGILDEATRDALCEELIAKHKLKVGRRSTLRQRLPSATGDTDLARLARLVADAKRERNLMDFDDLIESANTLLCGDAGQFRRSLPPRWLLVDEVQDCEARELLLLKRLAGPDTHFFAVGDPRQAIYGFRNGEMDVCAHVASDWQCRCLDLPRNYRSTDVILQAARAVLGEQPGPAGSLVGTREKGGNILVQRHHDPVSEAMYLSDRVTGLRSQGVPLGDMAILYRLRSQGEIVARVLDERGIPVLESALEYQRLSGEAIRLLTLHSAKGLEFRHVFICGVNQGVLPLGFTDIAEERRLLFVGITRARDSVEISYHARPDVPQALGLPSVYLGKIPASLVDWRDVPAAAAAVHSPSPASVAPTDAGGCGFHVGQTIRHPRYGQGVITAASSDAIDCDFGKLGAKTFSPRLCLLAPMQL